MTSDGSRPGERRLEGFEELARNAQRRVEGRQPPQREKGLSAGTEESTTGRGGITCQAFL
jgi:hypothetical protein